MGSRTRFTAALCLAGTVLVGCGAQAAPSNEPTDARGGTMQQARPIAFGPVGTDPTGTPLHTRLAVSSPAGQTGQALTATLGGTTFRGATGVWVGCEGTAATALYRLAGEYRTLTGVLGLQPHTPAGLKVRVTFSVDGESRRTVDLTRDTRPQTVTVRLNGARSLLVSALAVAGTCAPAAAPYGALGAASLT